jgi:outer membrane protein assembly factor BamB
VFQNAWFFDNAGGTTHVVGQQKPTALGLYDLFGNVSELSTPPTDGERRPFRLGGSFVDGTVYMAGEDGNLYALGAKDGALKWKTECGERIAGSPAVAYGLAFIGSGNRCGSDQASMTAGPVVGLDLESGQPVWKSAVSGGEYFGSWDGHLYALNVADDVLRWKLNLGDMPQVPAEQYKLAADEGGRIISSPWPGDGVVYVGCDNGCVYAVKD